MCVLDEDLGDQEEHAFLKVEGPDVYSPGVLQVIIEFFLRFKDRQEVPERMGMLDQVDESARF